MALSHRRTDGFWLIALIAICFRFGPALAQPQAEAAQTIIIRAGKLFDPAAGRVLNHPVVVIRGNKIESVSYGTTVPVSGAKLIDLGEATLLPGFIDVHTHLTMNAGGGGYESLGISTPRAALIGAKNAGLPCWRDLPPSVTSALRVMPTWRSAMPSTTAT